MTIKCRAYDLGIKRTAPRCLEILLHDDLTYNDWIKTCEYSRVDYESEEGQQILDVLNRYASEIGRMEVAFEWLLSADKVAASAIEANTNYILEEVCPGR